MIVASLLIATLSVLFLITTKSLISLNNKSISEVGVILYKGLKDQLIIVNHSRNEEGEEKY